MFTLTLQFYNYQNSQVGFGVVYQYGNQLLTSKTNNIRKLISLSISKKATC